MFLMPYVVCMVSFEFIVHKLTQREHYKKLTLFVTTQVQASIEVTTLVYIKKMCNSKILQSNATAVRN